ncbi:MAG TPA: RsbRD N-terminal domain-containing protein [Pyrinomonadaceae bacterium]|nr:RsbRD N-terminal domain-containing protein [Pyrinomonadaceae bacterium]
MSQNFTTLVLEHEESIVSAWVDGMYAEPRTEVPAVLSYGQLVDHLPDTLQEIASALDQGATDAEILEATRRLRAYPQVRFHQGALIDEVARELIIFRRVFNDFLWREGFTATEGDLRELRDALRRADRFVDELLAQVVVVYAASLRPPVATRTSVWPPPRRRRTDFPEDRRR